MCCIVEEEEDKNMKWLKLLVQWVSVGREQCNLNCVQNHVSTLKHWGLLKTITISAKCDDESSIK